MQRLRCCFTGCPYSFNKAAPAQLFQATLEKPTSGEFSVVQGCQDNSLLDVLLNSSRTADAQDWIYRCSLQLDAAAALLRANIRLYIAKEDGSYELLLGSIAELTGWSYDVTPRGVGASVALGAGKLDTTNEQTILEYEGTETLLFGLDASGPGTLRYSVENKLAVVPLSCGTGCFGALLLTPCQTNSSSQMPLATVERSLSLETDFASREPQLRQLGVALSLALTPELPELRRLAASLGRLSASSSLRETVSELCEALSYHVRQRFLLEPSVRAALVPEADATTAFLLDVAGVPLCQLSRHQLQAPPPPPPPAPPPPQQQQGAGSILLSPMTGGFLQSGPPPRLAPTATAGRPISTLVNLTSAPWDPVPPMPRPTLASGPRQESAARLAAGARPGCGSGRSPSPLAVQRSDAALAAAALASTATSAAGADGGGGPADGAATPQPLRLSPGNVAAACEAAGGSVVARPFQLSYSLLLRLQMQQPRIAGIAVRDCARLVQDVTQPSRDICLLMGSAGGSSTTALVAAASSILGDNGGQQGSSYGYKDSDAAAAVTATSLMQGGALSSGAAAAIGGVGASAVRSLALVGCGAGDGVTVAFYVCFPHRLPGQLVEAVRDSCQRLLEKVLLRAVAPKLTGDLAAELGALRRGTPGAFAVVQMSCSRAGSNLGMTSPAGPAAAALDTAPALTCSTTLANDLTSGFHFAISTANTITIIPPPAAASTATGTLASGSSGPPPPPPPALQRAPQAQSALGAVHRNLMLQLEAGGAGGLQGAVSARMIAGSGGCVRGGSSGGIGGGTTPPATAATAFSDLLSRSSSASISRSRSAATARHVTVHHHCPPAVLAAAGGGVGSSGSAVAKTACDPRRPAAAGAALSHHMGEVVVLPSRGRIVDATLLHAGGTESWVHMTPAATTGPSSAVADALQTFLSSSHCVSGSQLPLSAQEANVVRRAASVIVVRELEAEARAGCRQQLGALVSSVRDSITLAAAAAAAGGGGGGGGGGVPFLPAADTATTVAQLYDAETGTVAVADSGTTTGRIRAATSGVYLGWEEAAAGSAYGLGPAAGPASAVAAARGTGVSLWMGGCFDSEAADVADLRLVSKLGQGGGGSVFLGHMAGGLEVAVKLLELPESFDVAQFVEQFSMGPSFGQARGCSGGWAGRCGGGPSVENDVGALLAAEAARQQVRARRSLLQSATELAMLTSISHPNIVQVYGIYSNVVLETRTANDGLPTYRLRHPGEVLHGEQRLGEEGAEEDYSNVCSAVCMTLCDLGSLATALAEGGFPTRMGTAAAASTAPPPPPPPPPPPSAAARGPPAAVAPQAVDVNRPAFGASVLKHMRSVYLTLLEVALALRYLHGRNILHRDLKPSNILLKSRSPTPGDPRGFTTKLADFGLALVMDREANATTSAAISTTTPHFHHQHQQPASVLAGEQSHQQAQQPQRGLSPGLGDPGLDAPGHMAPPGRYALQDQACGTVDHMAPEACRGKGSRLSAACDVYSFGVVMLEAVTGGRRPFGEVPLERIGRLVLAGTRPLFPAWVPQQYRNLAEACWAHDPQARPSADQLVVALRQQLQRYPLAASAAAPAAVTAGGSDGANGSGGACGDGLHGAPVDAGTPAAPITK